MLKRLAVYLSFVRFSHSVFALPFALAGALLAAQRVAVTWSTIGWIVVAMVAARSAAMGFNRLADARFDALNPRTANRELPRGVMSHAEAVTFVAIASAVFVYAAWRLNPLCFMLSPVALAIVFWYSLAKRYTSYTQAFLGLAMAVVLCCIPMAIPQAHLPALCSDLGILASHGAAMLSVLLGTAFVSRQFWGWISDLFGGLNTVLIGSIFQILAMIAFMVTQDEVGLFTVAAAFGLGFAGIIPAYILAIRELFPASQAYWRIPTFLLASGSGMGAGAWLAGTLYDHFGFYAPAFAAGVAANAVNILIIAVLVLRGKKGFMRHAIS